MHGFSVVQKRSNPLVCICQAAAASTCTAGRTELFLSAYFRQIVHGVVTMLHCVKPPARLQREVNQNGGLNMG